MLMNFLIALLCACAVGAFTKAVLMVPAWVQSINRQDANDALERSMPVRAITIEDHDLSDVIFENNRIVVPE